MRTVVVAGSAQGPTGLLDAALGDRLRPQLRSAGTAFLSLAATRRAGSDPRAALADERAVVVARSGDCPAAIVTAARRAADSADELLDSVTSILGGRRAAVLLVVERQDSCAEHAIADMLFDDHPGASDELLDHATVARALRSDPRVAAVTVRPYELVGAGVATWVDDVLDLVGLRGRLDLRPLAAAAADDAANHELTARRGAISPTGLRLGRALRSELSSAAERDLFRGFLCESFAATEPVLDVRARADVVARHRDVNATLFREFAPDLPLDSYASDHATAALAARLTPVRVPPPALRVVARQRVGATKRALLRRVHRGG